MLTFNVFYAGVDGLQVVLNNRRQVVGGLVSLMKFAVDPS
jgi:hypothetical protein